MEQIKEALDEAIHKAGGLSPFVQAIHAPSTHAVKSWKRLSSIPADYCPAIERATGVACERLRHSVDWAYLRSTSAKPTTEAALICRVAGVNPMASEGERK